METIMFNRREFAKITLLTTAITSCLTTSAKKAKKSPNFVFVLVDDLGWNDLGCYGATFNETPNLDKLAKSGIRFTNGYAAHPVCSPTRASIMSGKNPCRSEINITDWIPGEQRQKEQLLPPNLSQNFPHKEQTIAETMKKNGYATYFLGKWHLGESDKFWPEHHGFDVNIGGWTVGSPRGGYYSPYKNPRLKSGPEGEYLTDRLTNEAIKLIKNTPKEKPFFLYLPFYTVHAPITACKRHLPKFNVKKVELDKELKKAGKVNEPLFKKNGRGWTRMRQNSVPYATMVYAMDENIGRLLKSLKDRGIDDNTIVIFSGDNGGLSTLQWKGAPASLLPLRAGKGWCYEGGIREPLIIKDPRTGVSGKSCDVPMISSDFYPTILELADLPLMPNQHKDGVSVKKLLTSPQGKITRTEPLVWHYPHYHGSGWTPGSAIRVGDWKLVELYHEKRTELYNLKDDISEKNNLAKKHPKKCAELRKELYAYLKKVGASMNKVNPNSKKKK